MLLAGILLKFGGYGMMRFMWFSELYERTVTKLGLVVGLWGGVLRGIMCFCQRDLKALIAYSSVRHMAMSLRRLLTFYRLGKVSCVSLLFAHGLCSPILFSLAGRCYDSCGSRNVIIGKGILFLSPTFSVLWIAFSIINMGVPPSLNFYRETMCLRRVL